MNREEISNFIHVGQGYLWLDEVSEVSDTHIVCHTQLKPELDVFQHHYLGFPLFPGSLQCEACFQASNILLTRILPANSDSLPVIARVDNVKFKQLVRPGDVLQTDVRILELQTRLIFLRGRCSVNGKATASLDFIATEAASPNSN